MHARFAVLGTVLAFVSGLASAQQLYRLTEIGPLSGTRIAAINESGEATGSFAPLDFGPAHAFLWSGGVMQDLGNLGGSSSSAGAAINASGQVAGSASMADGSTHAFFWDGTAMLDLGTLGGSVSRAIAINDAGEVTGNSMTASDETHAFLWRDGVMNDLGTLGGTYSYAEAINASGQVTGTATTAAGNERAFLWDGTSMLGLGTLGGKHSQGYSINAAGQVAGTSDTSTGEPRAFIWNGIRMKNLGTSGGITANYGFLINDAGQVAGRGHNADVRLRAFLWDGTAIRDLGAFGNGFPNVNAMNGSGQVIGHIQFTWTADILYLSSNGAPMQKIGPLIDPSDPLKSCAKFQSAVDINDRGQIALDGYDNCTEVYLPRGYIATPMEYQIVFVGPAANSKWKRTSSIPMKIALVDKNGKRITDTRANALIKDPCKVKFSANGAQPRSPICMKYNATTNEFYFNWKPGATAATGVTNLQGAATYKFSMPETITTTKSRAITITR